MLVFIDESGCPGFTLDYSSGPVFAMAMVVFENQMDAAIAQQVIVDLHKTTRQRSEFRFSKCKDSMRDSFFRSVCRCRFSVRAVVVRKKPMLGSMTRDTTRNFYRAFTRELLSIDRSLLRSARVRIDGKGSHEFTQELQRYLSVELGGQLRELRLVDSAKSPLIQLADMCVGAIARSYRNRHEADRWMRMLGSRIHEVRELK